MSIKKYNDTNVYDAARERIAYCFDNFEKIYVSFSGGKDSSVMIHMVADEAIKRNRKIGLLFIDLEGQYDHTIKHIEHCYEKYKDIIEPYWVCLPIKLRNAVSNFEPVWVCWDELEKDKWIRPMPKDCIHMGNKPFDFTKGMEFEEFMVEFGLWYSQGKKTCAFIGIRCDESLNRFRTIASKTKTSHDGKQFTTLVADSLYNAYPIYDWRTEDIWKYFSRNAQNNYNRIYDYMYRAGVPLSQQRLCQPYGDDQRRGLWLFHILEPKTWGKIVARVAGANSGALYVTENGNISGYNKISKPEGHTWESFFNLLFKTLPSSTAEHYAPKLKTFVAWWKKRGYPNGIPDYAPEILESKKLAPSWRRMCKSVLRNDWWCKGLGFSQPNSEAYGKYLQIKKAREANK